jgi:RNA polymerase sigma factor (sigma-70 family)
MPEPTAAHRAIEAVWKIEAPRLIAGLTRLIRDVGLAEELAQDAFLAALEQWPVSGIPDNPGAWLMATAKHRAIDRVRRDRRFRVLQETLAHERAPRGAPTVVAQSDARLDGEVEDDLLRLIFMACHPVLSGEARAAITLRLLCGLSTDEIARAFLVPEPTIAQRIVRGKRTLADSHIPFEVPRGRELADRLTSVLEVIYLLFNEGYSATAGDDWMRPALCEEAVRLGRILAGLMPRQAEVHGLVALMELQSSRLAARTDADGRPILLLDQNRAHWDRLLIRRGLTALETAAALRESGGSGGAGPYELQAAIAACHARARTGADTDWPRIVDLYSALLKLIPSPIIALNRAVAVSMARGPQAGLDILDTLAPDPALASYHLLPSVRGDLLHKLGRHAEAATEFDRAAALTRNTREQQLLRERARSSRGATA